MELVDPASEEPRLALVEAVVVEELELPPDTGTLKLLRSRDYGNTSLSIYGIA